MSYSTITLNQALSDLGRRLYDVNSIYWTSDEKTLYLQESIRTFGAVANFYRTDFAFSTTLNQNWYNIPALTSSPRPFSVTDVDLYTIIEDHFLEPPTGATWTGSNQFTIADLLQAVQRRRDQLLFETGCTLTRSTQATVNSVDNSLPETVIDIRRLAWLPNSNPTYRNSPLWRDDVWAQQSYARNRGGSGQPRIYKQSTQPPLDFTTDYIPAVAGNWELLTVNSGAILSTSSPTILGIPDDWCWVVKWGAMADLLSRESIAKDTARAAYCESRYQQGVALINSSPAVLFAKVGSNILDIDAVYYGDTYRVGWQAHSASTPNMLYIAGLNYVAMPAPTGGLTITLNLLQNSPFPASGAQFLQVGREDYDIVLDYAQHLASFKMGGAEAAATMPLMKNFFRHIATYNDKLMAMGEFTDVLYDQSQNQEQADPRLATHGTSNQGQGS